MRLLLVDDDAGLRALLRTTFEAVDVEVDEAVDAASAQRRIAEARPDAIVLDVSMPGMSGVELCARLKGSRATRDIPVVLLTSLGKPTDIIRGLECGADGFVNKPYEDDYLLGRIRGVLASRRLRTKIGSYFSWIEHSQLERSRCGSHCFF